MRFVADLKFAFRSFTRAKGLALTVIVTLALGIGANAAMFSVVRGVLLRPLVNRDEIAADLHPPERTGHRCRECHVLGAGNHRSASTHEDRDRVWRLLDHRLHDGRSRRTSRRPRGSGRRLVLRRDGPAARCCGRLIDATDDGPNAAGVAVLTHRFWTTRLQERSRLSSARRCGLATRSATIVGVLEPSVPYPTETEIIANVVTSPHHLSATMVTGRAHRMTELFGRLAPGADLEAARAELRAVHGAIVKEHPEAYPSKADFRIDAKLLRDQITSRARTVLLRAAGRVGADLRHRVLQRREPDPGPIGSSGRRAGHSRGARRRSGRAAPNAARGKPAALRHRGDSRRADRAADGAGPGRYASRFSVRALDLHASMPACCG